MQRLIDFCKSNRILVENFASLSILQVVGYILPLITLPYLVRVLGAEKYGLIAFASAFIAYFQILTDYGFGLSATREVSIHRENIKKISEIFSAVMLLKLGLSFLGFVIISIIILTFREFASEAKLYLFTYMMVLGSMLFPVWLFQGMERMRYITILNIISSLLFLTFIFLFIRSPNDYVFVPLIRSLGMIFTGILSLGVAFRDFKLDPFLPEKQILMNTLKDSTQYFLSRASVSVYTTSNVFFLGIFTNNLAVAYYSAAEKLYEAAKMSYQPLVLAIYPHISKSKDKILFIKLFKIALILNLTLCSILYLTSERLLVILYGNDFVESAPILKIFSLALMIVVPSILLGYPFLGALDFQKIANGSVIIGSIFHLIALFIVCSFFLNIYNIAILVLASEVVVLSIRLYAVIKHRLWR